MQYTILGKTGLKVSRLGFGCMRLPMKSETEVDREKAIPLLRRGYELGINLFDSSVGYCGGGSERVIGEALEDVREKIVLSTKNPHYDRDDKDTWWGNLEQSLERLRTDHIDIYNHHDMNYDRYEKGVAGKGGLYQEMLKAKEQGLIRHIGVSFHGPNEELVKLVDTGLFDTIIVQYNLLDRHLEEGIVHAAENGMGIMIMGPVGGGRLGYPSERAAELLGEVKSTPELALRFVLSNKNVNVALSGMFTMQQLEENAETVSGTGELTEEDHERIEGAIEERKKLTGLYCTGCNYCMPCPAGVDIPANFETLNLERVFGLTEHARERYGQLGGKAALCLLCNQCLEKCPQDIPIPTRLQETVRAFDERTGGPTGWGELRGGSVEEGRLRLKLRYILKNFSDQPQKASVRFLAHGEDRVCPQAFEVGQMKPYARKHKDIEIALPHPSEAYSLDVVVKRDETERIEHLCEMLAAARRVEGHSLGASERRVGAIHVPAASHPVHASNKTLRGRSFDFVPAYDEGTLYLFADVEDGLTDGGQGSCVRIYLDGRATSVLGRGEYTDGVMRMMLAPPADPDGELKLQTSNNAEIEAVWERTGTGYRLDCAIPWSAFVQGDTPPAVIGFDVAVQYQDPQGDGGFLLNWTGRPDGGSDTSAFGKLVMV